MTGNAAADRLYERFELIVNGPALFNAVVAGLDLGVFTYLAHHPGATFDELQRAVAIGRHGLRVLMLALCATELVSKQDDRFTNSAIAQELQDSDAPDSWRHILTGWQRIYYPAFAETTTALRSGTNVALRSYPGEGGTLYERLSADPALEQVFHRSMSAFTLRSMEGLLANADFASVTHLLDIGGADGTTAHAVTERFPHLAVTVFDMPSVAGRVAVSSVPEQDGRVKVHPGNFLADDFPAGADAVLFSHVLEVFREDQIRQLLAKAFRVLPAGGKVFVYGFNATDDERAGVFGARLSLYLNVLASGQGMAYPARDYETWLRETGYADVSSVGGLEYEHGLVVGTKP